MKINRHILDNGLRLVHSRDESTQMVALNILYNVGARDEHPEHTGFAHLFEHLMFGGSVNIPDYDMPLQLAGGENNAWTNNDITNYYLTVPRQNVETGFWLESDRMLSLDFSERSLEVQRGVVMEEFKQRCLNQPYGDVGHLLRPLAYQKHPYQWPTIGKDLSHVANATLEEVKAFFFRFYAPNNAILAVTGNISFEEAVELTEKWFGTVPRREVPVRNLPQEPEQTEERRLTVERNVPLDSLFMAYHMCDHRHPDYYVFDILSDVLSNGRSSRLNQHLVQEKQLFSSIDAYISGSVDAGLFHIAGKPSAGVSLELAEAAVRDELDRLQQELVDGQELEKVKNKFESTQIFGNINYLNEFSRKQNSFSTNPFFISYSQQLWGGGKLQRLENKIERAKNEVAVKQYCSNIAQIQQQALTLYLSAILSKMDSELAIDIKQSNDTLLHIAEIKLRNGSITEYDYKQMELQSLNLQYMYENAVKHYAESIQKLFTFLGIENNAEITIPDFDLPLTIDARLAIYYVKKNNPISNQQEIQQLEEEKNLFSIKLKNRFNGNISLNYGINQYAETLADAYRHGNTRQSVIIEFQIPIFQWGINKNNIRIAKNNYDASRLRIEKKNFEFENEVKEKINAYDHSVKLWLTASRAYALSKEQYKMLTKKFSLGKVSVYELATAQKERNDAMQRYYSAIKDSYESFFTLRNLALYDFKKNVELEKILFND